MNKCYIILLLIALSAQMYSQWELTILPSSGYDVESVKFFNPEIGLAATGGGGVLKTIDGGFNWYQSILPVNQWPTKIDIVVNDVAFAVGYPNYNIKSTDGGDTWFTLNGSYFNADWVLYNLDFVDDNIGWVTGARNDTFMVAKTTNGGSTWETKYLQSPQSNFNGRGLNFLNHNLGWISISRDSIIKTTNGGDTWSTIPLGFAALTNQIFFYNDSYGWIIGNGGKILSSQDGGNTWIEQLQLQDSQLFSTFFVNETKGWAVGHNYNSSKGIIMFTSDGGVNWSLQFENSYAQYNNTLYSVFFINDAIGWVGGYQGILFKTTNGGVTTVESSIITESSYNLYQNYPNPFNPTTKIKYSIPNKSTVSIKVYDLIGNEIATLVHDEKNKGTYEVEFNASELASGIYFCKMQSGSFIKISKIILIK